MAGMFEGAVCPTCGIDLGPTMSTEGLCPRCLLSLAVSSGRGAIVTAFRPDGSAPTISTQSLAPGRIIGRRYQIQELLGYGGMGEVWRALDLKLQVDIAIKTLRPERLDDPSARELLRQEVRSAREVISQNVCRIFDLIVDGDDEFVSMEFLDGTTLADILEERGPLSLQEVREIAAQFLSGLEAIHQAGLVHRDVKPENVLITRAARVVVMDLGLARNVMERPSRDVLGTVPYMSPEQTAGGLVDARADVFSAGVVLAEMLCVGGRDAAIARRTLWSGIRENPPRLPQSPWVSVLLRTLASNPDARYPSARSLARAIEEVSIHLPDAADKDPYPGLGSFTERDREFFFGREFDIEAMLRKLDEPRLLALVGPSGAGKTSFIRAGLLPSLTPDWGAVYCTPGNRPLRALARALRSALAPDADEASDAYDANDPDAIGSLTTRWQRQHGKTLIVIDQFEELFTANPPDVRDLFARVLLSTVIDRDVRVVISLRDDFLVRCHEHEALVSIFAGLTPLGMPVESSLRRALVQPALACGFAFEDNLLPDQMIDEVRGERGALPLLAFAASQMWERRDLDHRLLTRNAYVEIGGVGGALARHAEATLEQVGERRIAIVREIFRNLVSSEGTRIHLAIAELTSMFKADDERRSATEVLQRLVTARLLTTYEAAGDAARASQRIEIIHESLVTAWPRLVSWRAQDADMARFRDELRQAAGLWDARGRPVDLLWSGNAHRDLVMWRERYQGALSNTEEAFADASTRFASRRIKRRRLATAVLMAAIVVVATLTSVLWRRSEASRLSAEAEARRAEASKLLALGQLELDTFPTAALAYALRSLEVADSEVGRLFALRAHQTAPPATLTPLRPVGEVGIRSFQAAFSPDGEWLALGGFQKVQVFNRRGRAPIVLGDYAQSGARQITVGFGPGSDVLVANRVGDIRVWSFPDGREIRRQVLPLGSPMLVMRQSGFLTSAASGRAFEYRLWPFSAGESQPVGAWEGDPAIDPTGDGPLVYAAGSRVYYRSLDGNMPARLVADASEPITALTFSTASGRIAAAGASGHIRIWSLTSPKATRVIAATGVRMIRFDPAGARLAGIVSDGDNQWSARVWDLLAPPDVEPLVMKRSGQFAQPVMMTFDPSGQWLVTAHGGDAAFWPMAGDAVRVLRGHRERVGGLAFTPDGMHLISASLDGTVRSWPLGGDMNAASAVLLQREFVQVVNLAVDPASGRMAIADGLGHVIILSSTGAIVREFDGLPTAMSSTVALGDHGRLVAAAPYGGVVARRVIHVWDVETGVATLLPPVPGLFDGTNFGFDGIHFLDDNRVLASVGRKGLVVYDLTRNSGRALPGPSGNVALSGDGHVGVGVSVDPEAAPGAATFLMRFEPGSDRPVIPIHSYGDQSAAVAVNHNGTLIAAASVDGTVRIGTIAGGEPFLFFGHKGWARTLAFSPDSRWVASGGDDGTIRLWPVPDFSRPPLHTRRLDDLLAVLRSQSNVRVVPDSQSPTGWKLDRLRFQGWSSLPER